MKIDDEALKSLKSAESILALLHYRGIVDSEFNREDVAKALTEVRAVLGIGGNYSPQPVVPTIKRSWWRR